MPNALKPTIAPVCIDARQKRGATGQLAQLPNADSERGRARPAKAARPFPVECGVKNQIRRYLPILHSALCTPHSALVCFLLLIPSALGQINITYTVQDFGLTTNGLRSVRLTPIAKGGDYTNSFLVPSPMAPDTFVNGVAVFSNKVAGYAYSVEFNHNFSTTRRTNYFPVGLTGNVNGVDYLAWIAGFARDGSVIQWAWLYQTNLTGILSNVFEAMTNVGTFNYALLTNKPAPIHLVSTNDGQTLTNLNASNLASGTVPDARLAATIARTTELNTASNAVLALAIQNLNGIGTNATLVENTRIGTGNIITNPGLAGTINLTNPILFGTSPRFSTLFLPNFDSSSELGWLQVQADGNFQITQDGSSLTNLNPSFSPGFVATNEARAITISNTGNFLGGSLVAPAGSVGAPSIRFSNDADTGLYSSGANGTFSVAINGVNTWEFGDGAGSRVFRPTADNTYDIGEVAKRVANIYGAQFIGGTYFGAFTGNGNGLTNLNVASGDTLIVNGKLTLNSNVFVSQLSFATNAGAVNVLTLNCTDQFISTNNNIAFTGFNIPAEYGVTNSAWASVIITNNSASAFITLTFAGCIGDTTHYVTNQSAFTVKKYPGAGTNVVANNLK